MLLKCIACGAALSADRVNFAEGIATCRYCQAVMSFAELRARDASLTARDAQGTAERSTAPMPAKFQIDDSFGELRIRWAWFSPALIFLAFFCVVWNGFLLVWYSIAFATGAPWIMFVFPIIHLAVGVGLTYLCLASFLNITMVAVESGRLSVHHRPIPWPGNMVLDASQLEQLYCLEQVRQTKNGTHRSYEVHMLSRDGVKRKLLGGLDDPDQALFLEQQLEQHLGITDRPIAGELPR
jgi:hypothetical protein